MSTPQYLPQLTLSVDILQSLSRIPNKQDELSWKELQYKFDEAANIIKTYINETLLKAIEDNIASGGGEMSGTNITLNSMPANRLQNSSVTSSQMADGAITTAKIALGAITSLVLAANAVTSDKIANNAVTSGKIVNDAITTDKIADDAVTSDKIADNTVARSVNGYKDNVVITKFKSGTSTAFTEESTATLTDYPYRASITDADITANDKVYVEFTPTQINAGIYAPLTAIYEGGFYIYAEEAHTAETVAYTILKA